MTRYVVHATFYEKIAEIHVEAETRNEALAAFYQEFKGRVGPAWRIDVWEVDGKQAHLSDYWKGSGHTYWFGGYTYSF